MVVGGILYCELAVMNDPWFLTMDTPSLLTVFWRVGILHTSKRKSNVTHTKKFANILVDKNVY